MSLAFLDEGPGAPVRMAYAVGRRTGSAVVRNRVRRRLRAVFADLARPPRCLVPGGAILVAAGPDVVHRTHEELEDDVRSLLVALERRRSSEAR